MSWWTIWALLEWAIRLTMVLVILRRRFAPTTALAWMALVFFLPEVGVLLYLLIGGNRLGSRRAREHRRVIATLRTEPRLAGQIAHAGRPEVEPAQEALVLQAEASGGFAILGGNQVELLDQPQATIDRLITDIDAAQHHVHLLFYIFEPDDTGRRVAAALAKAVGRGVQCRLLADATGSRHFFGRHGMAKELERAGVHVQAMLPVAPLRRRLARLDMRNHRKLAIIDGHIAYTGSQNIVNADYGHRGQQFIDLMGRYNGPIVAQLQMVFLEDWSFDTDQVLDSPDILPVLAPVGLMSAQAVPTGPSEDDVDALPRVLLSAINAARRKLIITSPYLVPDDPTLMALAMAADRGVEVSIVLPRQSDHPLVAAAGRAYYEHLIESGIQIYLHQRGILHAKTMTVDDSFALLGSSNLDIRSFYLNFELNVLMFGAQITRQLRFAQTRYLSESDRVDLNTWRRRPPSLGYIERAAALFSPLL